MDLLLIGTLILIIFATAVAIFGLHKNLLQVRFRVISRVMSNSVIVILLSTGGLAVIAMIYATSMLVADAAIVTTFQFIFAILILSPIILYVYIDRRAKGRGDSPSLEPVPVFPPKDKVISKK